MTDNGDEHYLRLGLYEDAATWLGVADWLASSFGGDTPDLGSAAGRSQYWVWRSALALSCELSLKLLCLVSAGGRYGRSHKLAELYDDLPEDVRGHLDAIFAVEAKAGAWAPITVSAHRTGPAPANGLSLTLDGKSFGAFMQLLDEGQVNFRYGIVRYQFEDYAPGATLLGLSREANQIARTLMRCCEVYLGREVRLEPIGPAPAQPSEDS